MTAPRTELERWSQTASHWVADAEQIARMTRQVTDALVDRLAPGPGERILDLACGAGDPALSLAARLGTGSTLIALDPVREMVRAAARAAQQLGATDNGRLAVAQARAEELPLRDQGFDAVSCRFGVMFLQPVLGACREIHRVLTPGGRVVLAVWGPRERNPYFTLTHAALDEVGAAPLEREPGQPTVFEFARPGSLGELLKQAGFQSTAEQLVPFSMQLPDCGPEDFLERQAGLSPAVAQRLQPISAQARQRARQLVAENLAHCVRAHDLALPAEAILVTAVR